jgi:hypothetical protein
MIKDSKVNREKMDGLLNQPVDVQISIMHQHLDIAGKQFLYLPE